MTTRFGRRSLLKGLAAAPLLSGVSLAAAAERRVGGARILLHEGRVWMQVWIDGKGPAPFIVDTGAAVNLIRQDLARSYGMKELAPVLLRGVGGSQRFTLYRGRDVVLGGVRVGDLDFGAYPPDDLHLHREAAGALSTTILTTFDADLDFDRSEWRVYPDGRGERDGLVPLPSSIRGSARRVGAVPILVDVTVAGQVLKMELDTGAPGSLALFADATRRTGLWNDAAPYAPMERRGVGGRGDRARLIRVPEVGIGALRFERPIVSISDPEGSKLTAGEGLIGIGLIQQMNLSTDLKRGKLWAQRNQRPAPADAYGLSGLWIDHGEGRLVVAEVSPASPAAEAGIRVGDEIVGASFGQVLAGILGQAGSTVPLKLKRGGAEIAAEIRLRPFL